MDNTFGTIVSYRPDIKVVDATLRDGGLVNNFGFTTEFVKDLYKTNIAAGVDYMEFGYKASKDIFDPKDFGKWKFSNEDDIREIVGDNDSDLKICVMADVGRTDYKRDIICLLFTSDAAHEEERVTLCRRPPTNQKQNTQIDER